MLTDLRYAFRMLLKAPGFTLVAVVTLALGIGANSAIFSVIEPMLLRPLPFPDENRIVAVWGKTGGMFGDRDVFSYPNYADLRDQNKSFQALAAFTRAAAVLNQAETSQALEGVAISPQIFDVLGIKPSLGRVFTAAEDRPGAGAPVVVLTYPLWQRAFGGDRRIVGQQISLSSRSYTVLGVMPPGWKFPVEEEHVDYVIPLNTQIGANAQNRNAIFLTLVGRLKPNVSIAQATAELNAIGAHLAQQYPDSNTGRENVSIVTYHDDVVGNVRPALLVLSGAVLLVLLIACANVANLLLARAAARSREIAIRTALGASRAVVVRQLLCESLLLAIIGGTAGLLLAWWSVDLLGSLAAQALPHLASDSGQQQRRRLHLRARHRQHASLRAHSGVANLAAERQRNAAARRERLERRSAESSAARAPRHLAGRALLAAPDRLWVADQELRESARDRSGICAGPAHDHADQSAARALRPGSGAGNCASSRGSRRSSRPSPACNSWAASIRCR